MLSRVITSFRFTHQFSKIRNVRPISSYQIMSDMHLEMYNEDIMETEYFKPKANNLILAGDICNPLSPNIDIFFEYASKNWSKVLFVTGNHEYYNGEKRYPVGSNINKREFDDIIHIKTNKYDNVHWLENKGIYIDNVDFFGCTLWSKPIDVKGLNDFHLIYHNDKPITIDTVTQWNNESVERIKDFVTEASHNKKCIITHFMPLTNIEIPNNIYEMNEKYDSYFGNALDNWFVMADIWISGHTHQKFDFTHPAYGTRWICNAHGYPRELSYLKPKSLVIEI